MTFDQSLVIPVNESPHPDVPWMDPPSDLRGSDLTLNDYATFALLSEAGEARLVYGRIVHLTADVCYPSGGVQWYAALRLPNVHPDLGNPEASIIPHPEHTEHPVVSVYELIRLAP